MSNIENNVNANSQSPLSPSSPSSNKLTAVSGGKDISIVINPSQLKEVQMEVDRIMATTPCNPRAMVERQLLFDKGLIPPEPSPPPIRRSQHNAA